MASGEEQQLQRIGQDVDSMLAKLDLLREDSDADEALEAKSEEARALKARLEPTCRYRLRLWCLGP